MGKLHIVFRGSDVTPQCKECAAVHQTVSYASGRTLCNYIPSLGLVFENNEIKHQTLVGVERNSISKDTYTHTHKTPTTSIRHR